jgi:hypothetical protein
MFNVRDTKLVPGFHVREPMEEVPGFRVAPDGSILEPSVNIPSARDQSLRASDSWLQPWPTAKPGLAGNLDNLCAKCLVKRLGYEDIPSSELPKLLEPWLIRGRVREALGAQLEIRP